MGRLVITYGYRIHPDHRDDYLASLDRIRENAMNLGCLFYMVREDDGEPNLFVETMVYESWLSFELAGRQGVSDEMETIFMKLDKWIEGGIKSIDTGFSTLIGFDVGEDFQS